MKKNISINISGIIFHIEEDGYDNLRKYLDSITKYFSSFEDSSEIMADIEGRIAEIFLSKLNEGKQVITAEDVTFLMTTMGSVSDFKAAEEQDAPQAKNTSASTGPATDDSYAGTGPRATSAPRPLMRDQRRKILGGVCTGLGNYFNIDPLWIRLLFAVVTFAYGLSVVIYLVLWIILPGSYTLEEPQVDKKMFRDPDSKVLAGVSGGIASYLGIDILIVRVLFIVFTITGGLGFVVYIVLWIAVPEAKSLTERMQMQGEPVTLSNIESTIKKNLKEDPDKEESAAAKILLLPFRLLAMLLLALAKVIGPLVEVLRVAVGIVIILLGVALAFATLLTAGITLGYLSTATFASEHFTLPVEAMTRAFPGWIVIAGFVACFIPCIFIILLGASAVSKRITFGGAAGWTLFVLFFVSIVALTLGVPKLIFDFKEEGTHRVETVYPITAKRAVFRMNETGMDDYDEIWLSLQGYNGKEIKLVQEFEAQGSSRKAAIENAQMVDYNVVVEDSIFTFDSNITFRDDAIFRAQRLKMTLFIPYDYPFTMTEDVARFITQFIESEALDNETWRMTPDGLSCLSCPAPVAAPAADATDTEFDDEINQVEIDGLFDLEITRGDKYTLEIDGSESEKAKYRVEHHGSTVVIDYDNNHEFRAEDLLKEVKIRLTLPALESLSAQGKGEVRFTGFRSEHLNIEFSGKISGHGEMEALDLTLDLSGACDLDLKGNGDTMHADLSGLSSLEAYRFTTKDASVEVSGASSAKVNVTENLQIEKDFVSKVEYRGNPHVTQDE
ncbi:PspC domain-containing protein [Parachryseolinea silvisoli]|uniref:PspC domain-containing protein n=1 Tax=Parachryseolinea silvisoli TaxID=2873601 RepID=UPI002265DDB2|nr:PspC domain-containing protein [Parachryseolinea silvisoli]MCD9015309.1 PspC domain-containing protein [Parachryseolinea silvisoli]